ncbi:hypothetical protein [Ornithinimicrobium kibberense]|uniref:hypothetical protein n=1 Tax=Ornithinimicrobium kibberense TaxID=282060 RepID=UPI00360D4F5A
MVAPPSGSSPDPEDPESDGAQPATVRTAAVDMRANSRVRITGNTPSCTDEPER